MGGGIFVLGALADTSTTLGPEGASRLLQRFDNAVATTFASARHCGGAHPHPGAGISRTFGNAILGSGPGRHRQTTCTDTSQLGGHASGNGAGGRRWQQQQHALRRFRGRARQRWVQMVTQDINDAADKHDIGKLYTNLRKLGVTIGDYDKRNSSTNGLEAAADFLENRGKEPTPEVLAVVDKQVPERPQEPWLGWRPSLYELRMAVLRCRESAAGPDEVTKFMLRYAGQEFMQSFCRACNNCGIRLRARGRRNSWP